MMLKNGREYKLQLFWHRLMSLQLLMKLPNI